MDLAILETLKELRELIVNKNGDRWMSLREASRYCRLSETTIRRHIARGSLKASRKTGKVLLKKSSLDKWLT